MRTDELDYGLPDDAIAQTPAEPRDSARLLVDRGTDVPPADSTVADLHELIRPGDLVVLNDTRVLPARVSVRRTTGGEGEILLLEEESEGWWRALCRPSRKLREGEVVTSAHPGLRFEMGGEVEGVRLVRPLHEGTLHEALAPVGQMPLPPYITRQLTDADRYQTVYADRPGSAAAPTAGLHLTPAVLEGLERAGARLARVELVVGLDTFRPIVAATVEDHDIHSERYRVPEATVGALDDVRAQGGRVVAVGTTTVRALESFAATGRAEGRTRLFITPGFEFRSVDALMTNFHLPRSSLLAMIEAFVGARWRELYRTALDRGYRFLSFGDATWLERATPRSDGPGDAGVAHEDGTHEDRTHEDGGA